MSMFHGASYFTINDGSFNISQVDPETIGRLKGFLEDDERRKVMTWVSPTDFSAMHFDVADRRHPGTGQWLLNTDDFQDWEQGTGKALWCPGIPGAGKTVLASLVIDHLRALQLHQPIGTMAVAWVYFNYKEQAVQTPDAVLLGLTQQLAGVSTDLYGLLKSAWKLGTRPSARRLIPDMGLLTREFSKVFIVVDALDECAESNRDAILGILAELQRSGANILVTSRDHVYDDIVESDLMDVRTINIRASSDDIAQYVNARLTRQKRLAKIIRTQPSLQDEIVRVIVGSCEGMFLMATFHVESLGKYINVGKIREALQVLPKTFPGIYDEAMDRIESDKDHSKDAFRVLSILIHARRPLTVTELQHFLAVQPGDTDLCEEYITDKDILLSICAGLIVIDDQTSIVRLVHFTAHEYFDQIRASKFPLGDQEMGHTCLTYLSFDALKNPSESDGHYRYPLLKYIMQYWHLHVLNHQTTLQTPLSILFKDYALILSYSYRMWKLGANGFSYHYRPDDSGHESRQIALHAAAAAGLHLVVAWLVADGASVNSSDVERWTALMQASHGGHTELVDFLITEGADISMQNIWGATALQVASKAGHEGVVKLLLDNGADVNAQDLHYGTALAVASHYGHKAVVIMLLKHGADINHESSRGYFGTALRAALSGGQEEVVKLLVENGADEYAVASARQWRRRAWRQ